MEEWRDIEGYQGLYQVSNMGRVKSLERTVWNNGGYYKIPERIMKPQMHRNGYLSVNLWREGIVKNYLVHRLVATAFIPNPQGYKEVNHINEDKTDNRVCNLEFCSRSYNLTYNDRAKKIAEKNSKPIYGINKVSGLIVEFPSAREAGRTLGINNANINSCLKGRYKSSGGFYWFYAEEGLNEQE